jgi:hypothetical protein
MAYGILLLVPDVLGPQALASRPGARETRTRPNYAGSEVTICNHKEFSTIHALSSACDFKCRWQRVAQ